VEVDDTSKWFTAAGVWAAKSYVRVPDIPFRKIPKSRTDSIKLDIVFDFLGSCAASQAITSTAQRRKIKIQNYSGS
jgi:hypothetical protein